METDLICKAQTNNKRDADASLAFTVFTLVYELSVFWVFQD